MPTKAQLLSGAVWLVIGAGILGIVWLLGGLIAKGVGAMKSEKKSPTVVASAPVVVAEKSSEEQLAELPLVKDMGTIGGRYVYRYVLFVEDTETDRVTSGFDRYWEKESESSPAPPVTPLTEVDETSAEERGASLPSPLPLKPEVAVRETVYPPPEEVKSSSPPAPKKTGDEKKGVAKPSKVVWHAECPFGHLHHECRCSDAPYLHCHPCCGVAVRWWRMGE